MIVFFKFIILFLIFITCTSIGKIKASEYNNRLEELKKIKSALEVFRSKIEFTYEPIKDIFYEISNIVYSDKNNIFFETVKNLELVGTTESWNLAINSQKYLKNEDKSTIKMFGKLLGKTDKSGQINEINVTTKMLDKLIEDAEIEKNKNYKLFNTLGIVAGIGICIILV